jgi:hypothetical protein
LRVRWIGCRMRRRGRCGRCRGRIWGWVSRLEGVHWGEGRGG